MRELLKTLPEAAARPEGSFGRGRGERLHLCGSCEAARGGLPALQPRAAVRPAQTQWVLGRWPSRLRPEWEDLWIHRKRICVVLYSFDFHRLLKLSPVSSLSPISVHRSAISSSTLLHHLLCLGKSPPSLPFAISTSRCFPFFLRDPIFHILLLLASFSLQFPLPGAQG